MIALCTDHMTVCQIDIRASVQVLVLHMQTYNSIEERVAAVANEKRNFADRSINGGFFDGQTSAETRRQYLMDLLKVSASSDQSASSQQAMLSDAELDKLLIREENAPAQTALQGRRIWQQMNCKARWKWQTTNRITRMLHGLAVC